MKVAMVSEHASPLAVLGGVDAGGQNVHVAALAGCMTRAGHEVVVYTRRDDPALPRRVTMTPGFTVEHVDAGPPAVIAKDDIFPHVDLFARRLYRAWRAERPDVVHSHFWMSGYATLQAAKLLGIPVCHTFHALGIVKRRHQGDKDTSPPERVGLEKAIVGFAECIVATCSDEVFELLRMGADRRRVRIVPCGVDPEVFNPDGPREARGDRARVVVVSRLVERKGIGDVIEAIAQLPGVELVIAGGPDRDKLESDAEARRLQALAREHGVADRVQFRGRLERGEVPALMRSADVVVSVPWYEPFGIVPIEAMACGAPVVVTPVGGMIDTVVDGRTGVYVPPRDARALASALRHLLSDADMRGELGRAAALRVRRRYAWERVTDDLLDVYASVAPMVTQARRSTR